MFLIPMFSCRVRLVAEFDAVKVRHGVIGVSCFELGMPHHLLQVLYGNAVVCHVGAEPFAEPVEVDVRDARTNADGLYYFVESAVGKPRVGLAARSK